MNSLLPLCASFTAALVPVAAKTTPCVLGPSLTFENETTCTITMA